MDQLSLLVVGSSGSVPTPHRGLPATLVRADGTTVLFDCGEGTQRQLLGSVGLVDIDAIFLTHFHADHWLGLGGMLKTFDLRGRERPLTLRGPAGTERLVHQLEQLVGRTSYPVTIEELEPHDAIEFDDGWLVEAIAVEHRGHALGYVIEEEERPGRFDAAKAKALGVAPGPDFGRLQAGEAVDGVEPHQVVGPPRPGRTVVLSGDTRPCDAVREAADGADVLIHEATFLAEESARALETKHSTTHEAAKLAGEAGVDQLVLVHLSTRTPRKLAEEEARTVFPAAVAARDLDLIEVPIREKAKPRVLRWDRRAREHVELDPSVPEEEPAEVLERAS